MSIFTKIKQNNLFKVTSLNSLSILVRVVTGLISSKAIAYFIGPSGMALMGNFRNFSSLTDSIGILGLQNGIIQDVALNQEKNQKIHQTSATVFYTVAILGVVIAISIVLFSNFIGNYLFDTNKYQLAIQFLGLLFPFQLLSLVINAVLNGLSAYKKVVVISIITYVIGLLISLVMMWKFQIIGAMISVSITTFLLFFVSLYFLNKIFNLRIVLVISNVKKQVLFTLLPLGIMTLFSAIISPLIYIFIRNYIIEISSIEAAGFYEAITKISGFYFMFIATIMTFYFLPELSKTSNKIIILSLFKSYYLYLIPVFTFGLLLMYVLKDLVIYLLLTKEFLPVSNLFFWQLIGDFFRALSLILGMYFFAKKMLKPYFITEVISFAILFISSYFFIGKYGVEGAIMGYALTYFLYFLVLVTYFLKNFKIQKPTVNE